VVDSFLNLFTTSAETLGLCRGVECPSRIFFYFVFTYGIINVGDIVVFAEKGRMAESCGWVFVDNVPLIYDKRRVARQLQVETWLQLSQLVTELKMEDLNPENRRVQSTKGYIA
jgi:hypothetical protein